jgi:type IV fimbrial biogenesis protein FimT
MKSKSTSGFTLVELVITMAIISIITALAAPSFSSMVERNTLVAETNRLLGNFRMARNEAVKRHAIVSVAGQGNNWQNGFNVYANNDSNVDYDDVNDQIIRKESGLSDNVSIATNANVISFASNGSLNVNGANTITMFLCKTSGATVAMEVRVNRIGRAEAVEIKDVGNCPGN